MKYQVGYKLMQHVQGEEWGFPRSFITEAFIPQIHFCELWKESDAHFL